MSIYMILLIIYVLGYCITPFLIIKYNTDQEIDETNLAICSIFWPIAVALMPIVIADRSKDKRNN